LGLAKALLQHVESRALEKFPCSLHVRLLVREDNLPANQMYVTWRCYVSPVNTEKHINKLPFSSLI
jgi:hypothetical protein